MLGVALGEYFCGRCLNVLKAPPDNQTFLHRTFVSQSDADTKGIDDMPTTEFNPFSGDQDLDQQSDGTFYFYSNSGAEVPPSIILNYFWGKAQAEWNGRFGMRRGGCRLRQPPGPKCVAISRASIF